MIALFKKNFKIGTHMAAADMIEYCAKLMDKNGQIVRVETLNSSDDVAAMTAAEKLVDGSHDVVVWHQNRLLVRLSHGSKC
jgi:hypothetical protein